ncbi:MAG: hypothetical protein HPY62_00075 [Bacteroidales bacterium]|nr:hypothetical protein [Bacteroidales bacterium]
MKKIKIISGIIWAFMALIIILILFPGLNSFSVALSKLPFMKINPNFAGGDAAFSYVQERCTLVVRKPVFDGLLSERKHGFVQLDWRGELPDVISDTIDFDRDGGSDFVVNLKRNDAVTVINPLSDLVTGLNVSVPTSYGWTVRVGLKRE